LGLRITLLRLRKKQTNSTPSTSSNCSSLTTKPMVLKFGENLLHLLKKTFLNFTQIQRWIWEEQLFKIKLQGFCHGNLSMNSTITPTTSSKWSSLTAKPMVLTFSENRLHFLDNNCLKFDTNPTVDLGGTTI
jgi:hypothetical protein